MTTAVESIPADVVLRVSNMVVSYPAGRGREVQAVSGVSFDVQRGETLGIVGESGCGKSSLARTILQLQSASSGAIWFNGKNLDTLGRNEMRRQRTDLQIILQDPISALNPRRRVHDIVAEGLAINKVPKPWNGLIERALSSVGLDLTTIGDRRPGELSGGQCQRVAVARALVVEPDLLVCDEPVSALDVSVQAQILNLLEDMKQQYDLTLIFIAHDLAVVRSVSDRVVVMYLGKVCEIADAERLYAEPQHPYTQALLSAVPQPELDQATGTAELAGDLPSPLNPPSGCRFHTRCPRAQTRCTSEEPALVPSAAGDLVACHFPGPADRLHVATAPTPEPEESP